MATCTDEHVLRGLFSQEIRIAWIPVASALHLMHASVVRVQVIRGNGVRHTVGGLYTHNWFDRQQQVCWAEGEGWGGGGSDLFLSQGKEEGQNQS